MNFLSPWLMYVNHQFLVIDCFDINNKPMVDDIQQRFSSAPAPTLRDFKSLKDWLKVATEIPGSPRSGLQRQLAAYITQQIAVETVPQVVTKWLQGSLPELPKLRAIADWARVPYEDLKLLYDRDMELRQSKPKRRRGGRPEKRKSSRRGAG